MNRLGVLDILGLLRRRYTGRAARLDMALVPILSADWNMMLLLVLVLVEGGFEAIGFELVDGEWGRRHRRDDRLGGGRFGRAVFSDDGGLGRHHDRALHGRLRDNRPRVKCVRLVALLLHLAVIVVLVDEVAWAVEVTR